MNDIAGAIGIVQLEKLRGFISRRKEIDGIYRKELQGVDGISICPEVPDYCTSSYYTFWIQTEKRNALARYLLDKGIYTTFRYWPLHKISFFKSKESFCNADFAANYTLNLPLHQSLTDEEVGYVIATIKSFHG
jgi:aminotransferase